MPKKRKRKSELVHVPIIVPGFAKLVRDARELRGWSQADLVRASGVSPMCVSNLEREVRSPSLQIAQKIAIALNLSVLLSDPAKPIIVNRGESIEPPTAVTV